MSLTVGVTSGVIALTLGAALGILAAYAGGRFEQVLMRIVDIQLGFPAILVALMLIATLGKGVDKVIIALSPCSGPTTRAPHARRRWSSATRSTWRRRAGSACRRRASLLRHLLPNTLPPLIVVGTVQVAHAIALEATLSFLGLGLPTTEPSLGLLIANGYEFLLSGKYWISVYPGIALLATILAINLVGDQLRDVLNPRLPVSPAWSSAAPCCSTCRRATHRVRDARRRAACGERRVVLACRPARCSASSANRVRASR